MTGADKVAAIRAKAEVLAGRSLGDNGDALMEMAAQRACAWCNREDIPEDMEQAVNKAYSLAESGDVVALSPASTSFDKYRNFEYRGRDFKEKVNNLK